MQLRVWFLLIFILTFSSGSNDEGIKEKGGLKPDEIPDHLNLYLKVVSKDKFHRVLDLFKSIIAEFATKYCKETLVLHLEDLKKENVLIEEESSCPDSWSYSETCIIVTLKIKLNVYPFRLNEIHLDEIWRNTKKSGKLKELEIEEYQVTSISKSYRVLIVTLIIIIVILGIVLAVLSYIFWEKIIHLLCCSKGNGKSAKEAEDDSWTYRNNEIYDSAYIQPPGYTSYNNDQSYIQPIQKSNPQYLTVLSEMGGNDNRGYQPDNRFNPVQHHSMTTKANDESDEFDSGEEFSYPSPLKAPPVPPRNESSGESRGSTSGTSQSTLNTNVSTSVHYLSSPIRN